MEDSALRQRPAVCEPDGRCDHGGVGGGVLEGKRRAGLVEAVERVAVEPELPAAPVDPLVVLYPLLLVVVPGWVLRLRGQQVEVVREEPSAVLARHLQDLGSLLGESSRAVLLEVLEHHAAVDELPDEQQVLRLPQRRKPAGRNGSIADEFRGFLVSDAV